MSLAASRWVDALQVPVPPQPNKVLKPNRRRRRSHSHQSTCKTQTFKITSGDEGDPFLSACWNHYQRGFESYGENERCMVDYIFWSPLIEWLETQAVRKEIRALRIEHVDRGVRDFGVLVRLLQRVFPSLEFLMWSQNYGSDDLFTFLNDAYVRGIKHLYVSDCQSRWHSLLPSLQHRSLCAIKGGTRCLEFHLDNGGMKDYDPVFVVQMARNN